MTCHWSCFFVCGIANFSQCFVYAAAGRSKSILSITGDTQHFRETGFAFTDSFKS
jgi:hypothetical protein